MFLELHISQENFGKQAISNYRKISAFRSLGKSLRYTEKHKDCRDLLICTWRCLSSNSIHKQITNLKGREIAMWLIISCLSLVHPGNTDQQQIPLWASFSLLWKTRKDAKDFSGELKLDISEITEMQLRSQGFRYGLFLKLLFVLK